MGASLAPIEGLRSGPPLPGGRAQGDSPGSSRGAGGLGRNRGCWEFVEVVVERGECRVCPRSGRLARGSLGRI